MKQKIEKKTIVVLTGAGISAESGLETFRSATGLWNNFDHNEVAHIKAWAYNKENMLKFYNDRRNDVRNAKPNVAHKALAELQKKYNVLVITQNIDNLHERAGSKNVLHLHGEIMKSRSTLDPNLIYDVKQDINIGDRCAKGSQLRPEIVWFGEDVPKMEEALIWANKADIFIVVGTSLNVYPAASIINYVPYSKENWIIDPNPVDIRNYPNFIQIKETATKGVPELVAKLME